MNKLTTKMLQLILTERCNLNCVYCYEHSKSGRTMSGEVAKAAVERHLSDPDPTFDRVFIDMFGGEPLLAFPLIQEIVDFVHSRRWPRKHGFSVGTNATLLDDVKKAWLAKHRSCLSVTFSLDGTKEAHDLNRNNSYDAVVRHVDFFRENWPGLPAKMTISRQTIPMLADGIMNIVSLGLPVEANVVFEDAWGSREEKFELLREYARQLSRLVEFFAKQPESQRLPRIINMPTRAVFIQEKNKRWCGSGKYMTAVAVDGTEYPCQRFIPFCGSFAKTEVQGESRCESCPLVNGCPTCYGHNQQMTGRGDYRTDFHCEFMLLQFMATAKLAQRRAARGIRTSRHDAEAVVKAARFAEETLTVRLSERMAHHVG